uniref:Uncharacterized protein LOC114341756 n=1 Tax=Diabrotica virgifera virgifera TaxID=50390 RepID=A0A6P7GFF9_DIAVI
MSDYATHFPPQTYSSSFYINSLAEGDKTTLVIDSDDEDDNPSEMQVKNSPLLDCFISTFLSGDKKAAKKPEIKQTIDINKKEFIIHTIREAKIVRIDEVDEEKRYLKKRKCNENTFNEKLENAGEPLVEIKVYIN